MSDERIEQLALTKHFDELNDSERALVLEQMSQVAYENLRTLLQTARQLDAGAMPPADLKLRLLRQLSAQPRPSLWSRGLRLQVSAWQAAAAVAALVGATWFLARRPTPLPAAPAILVQVQRDTVRDTIWQEKIVWRERIRPQDATPIAATFSPYATTSSSATSGFDTLTDNAHYPLSIINYPLSIINAPGTSMGDVPELFDFLTENRK